MAATEMISSGGPTWMSKRTRLPTGPPEGGTPPFPIPILSMPTMEPEAAAAVPMIPRVASVILTEQATAPKPPATAQQVDTIFACRSEFVSIQFSAPRRYAASAACRSSLDSAGLPTLRMALKKSDGRPHSELMKMVVTLRAIAIMAQTG